MKLTSRIALLLVLVGLVSTTTGCRYASNRYYDLRDTFALGAGITAENPSTGVVPVALGAHIEVTNLLQFGWMRFNGYVAEVDLRGTFVGPEASERFGFLWWQMLRINQDYENALYMNRFKDEDFAWCHRMESVGMRNRRGQPAKSLHYEYWAPYRYRGTWLLHRGHQYWEYIGASVGICDPFVTHFGVMARFGFDISELSDFVLGWVGIDYRHDDMTREEYRLFRGKPWLFDLVPARPRQAGCPLQKSACPKAAKDCPKAKGECPLKTAECPKAATCPVKPGECPKAKGECPKGQPAPAAPAAAPAPEVQPSQL